MEAGDSRAQDPHTTGGKYNMPDINDSLLNLLEGSISRKTGKTRQKRRSAILPMTQKVYKPHEVKAMQQERMPGQVSWEDELRKLALKYAADKAKREEQQQAKQTEEQRKIQREDEKALRDRIFSLQDKLSKAESEQERAIIERQLAELGAASPPPEISTQDIADAEEAKRLREAGTISAAETEEDLKIKELKERELDLNKEYDRLSQEAEPDEAAKQSVWEQLQDTGTEIKKALETKLAKIDSESPPILREFDRAIRDIRKSSDLMVTWMNTPDLDPDAYEDIWQDLGELNRRQRYLEAKRVEIEQKLARGEAVEGEIERLRNYEAQQRAIAEEKQLEAEKRRTELEKTITEQAKALQEREDILYPEGKAAREAQAAGMKEAAVVTARETAREEAATRYEQERLDREAERDKLKKEREVNAFKIKEEYKQILAGKKADETFINDLLEKEYGMRTDEEWEWTEQVRTLRHELQTKEAALRSIAKDYRKDSDEYKDAEEAVTLASAELKKKEIAKPSKELITTYIERRKKLLKKEITEEGLSTEGTEAEEAARRVLAKKGK